MIRLRAAATLMVVGVGYSFLALVNSDLAHSIINGYLVVAVTVLLLAILADRPDRRKGDIPSDQRPLATRGDFRRFERFAALALFVVLIGFGVTAILLARQNHKANELAGKTAALARENAARLSDIDAEVKARTQQFCTLQIKRVRDLEKQVRQTRAFLGTPAAEDSSALTAAVKANLPRVVHAAHREREGTPPVCFRVVK